MPAITSASRLDRLTAGARVVGGGAADVEASPRRFVGATSYIPDIVSGALIVIVSGRLKVPWWIEGRAVTFVIAKGLSDAIALSRDAVADPWEFMPATLRDRSPPPGEQNV